MLLTGDLILDTIDMLGEWDFMSTLLRVGVQQGAGRLVISPEQAMEGHLARVTGRSTAELALEALPSESRLPEQSRPGLLRRLATPLLSSAARALLRRQISPPRLVLPAIGLSAIGAGLAAFGWPVTAIVTGLVGLTLFGIAQTAGAMLLHPEPEPRSTRAMGGLILLAIAIIAVRAGSGEGYALVATLLALASAVLALLRDDDAGPGGERGSQSRHWWSLDLPIMLLIMLIAVLAGLEPLGLAFIGGLALAELALDRVGHRAGRQPASPE
jgi:hypothetical protein